MALQVTKESIDLGIVIRDSEASLRFYRDTVGLEHVMDIPMPVGGKGVMHRLKCGTSLIKLIAFDNAPEASNPPPPLGRATGIRYLTISVPDVAAITAACEEAGYKVLVKVGEVRPGVTISMVADPDGNVVEFLHMA